MITKDVYTITRVTGSGLSWLNRWSVCYIKDGQEWTVAMRPSLRGAAPGKLIEIQINTETDLIASAKLVK